MGRSRFTVSTISHSHPPFVVFWPLDRVPTHAPWRLTLCGHIIFVVHLLFCSLKNFVPSFGGSRRPEMERNKKYQFQPNQMQQIGLMLSLRLASGQPNPTETFGQGRFPFSLHVQSIEFLNSNQT